MEQQIQCPECHTWNSSDKSFCEKCGARLHPFVGEWWKELNMLPVRQTKIMYRSVAHNNALIAAEGYFCVCAIICMLFAALTKDKLEEKSVLLTILLGIFFIVLFVVFCKKNRKFVECFNPDSTRKRRQELLDGDYVEVLKKRWGGYEWKQYLMVARGTGASHKVGIFDTRNVKLCIPMIYEKLEWIKQEKGQNGQLLKGVLNGYPVIIDVNGNQYE